MTTKTQSLMGGWTPYHKLTNQDRMIFEEALKGFVGVNYSPNSVSTQVVAGKNYRFKCTASMLPSEIIWEAIVEISNPLNNKPYITGIIRI